MTRTAAIRRARWAVTMRRQGGGWIVESYDPEARAIRESHEMPYDLARREMGRLRLQFALEEMGYDWETAEAAVEWCDRWRPRGSLADRLRATVERWYPQSTP